MIERKVTYFDEGGPENTDRTLQIGLNYLKEEEVSQLVVASGGDTLLKVAKLLEEEELTEVELTGVTLQAGTWKEYGEPDWEKLKEAKEVYGANVLTTTHALMGNVGSAVKDKFGGLPPGELIARTYYTFSQGTKVAAEITLNAVDAGLIPEGEEVLALAGTDRGADTALIIEARSTVDFFDLEVKELLCKPR